MKIGYLATVKHDGGVIASRVLFLTENESSLIELAEKRFKRVIELPETTLVELDPSSEELFRKTVITFERVIIEEK